MWGGEEKFPLLGGFYFPQKWNELNFTFVKSCHSFLYFSTFVLSERNSWSTIKFRRFPIKEKSRISRISFQLKFNETICFLSDLFANCKLTLWRNVSLRNEIMRIMSKRSSFMDYLPTLGCGSISSQFSQKNFHKYFTIIEKSHCKIVSNLQDSLLALEESKSIKSRKYLALICKSIPIWNFHQWNQNET